MKTTSLLGCQNTKTFLTKANALVLSGGNLVALTSPLKTSGLPFAGRRWAERRSGLLKLSQEAVPPLKKDLTSRLWFSHRDSKRQSPQLLHLTLRSSTRVFSRFQRIPQTSLHESLTDFCLWAPVGAQPQPSVHTHTQVQDYRPLKQRSTEHHRSAQQKTVTSSLFCSYLAESTIYRVKIISSR